jgi:methionyl aminopeptidase
MTLSIEPILALGTLRTRTRADGWTVVTTDGGPACHVEHTVAVTSSGATILTSGR